MDGFVDVSAMLRRGVYILLHQGVVVYVGQASLMLGRTYSHRVAWGTKKRKPQTAVIPAKGMLFDQIMVRPCQLSEANALEIELIKRYRPRHNIQHKTSIPPELTGLVARIVASRGGVVPPSPRIERRGF